MSIVIFALLRLAPGDIVDILFSTAGYVSPAEKQALMKELGIDRPYWAQYLDWLRQIVTGDLGKSYRYDLPAWPIIRPLLPVTLELAALSMVFAILLGVPTGVVSAVRQDSPLDYVLRVVSLAGLSMPAFWLGMVIILGLVTWFRWIPPLTYVSPTESLKLHAVQFPLPALAVGYRSSALIMRITRSSLHGCGMAVSNVDERRLTSFSVVADPHVQPRTFRSAPPSGLVMLVPRRCSGGALPRVRYGG